MGDTTEEKAPASGNSSTEEELVKSEKIEQPSEDKLLPPLESREKKLEKLHEGIELKKTVENLENNKKEKTEEKDDKLDKKPSVVESEKETPEEKLPVMKEESKLVISNESLLENPANKISVSVPCCTKEPREKIVRNQSDIFSLKDIATTLQTSIFSVNGSPSRKVFRKQEPAGHVFQKNENPPSDIMPLPTVNRITRENYNDEKRPSSSYRNPLTGTGLSSNDEYKSKGIKRKDGNPLLGLGYDSEVTSSPSQHRVPPGGYSHKLW